ncbi:MAG: helix-turn-helix domain-containing protein [Lachnospiraceae bacterium]|nr:helix-turn-helix domain-containing protein [Ruminococcus sp.]MCM1273989.1 helix-turn-helix domain-containing protein [Lachnospiraceae bacterium]
MYKNFVQLLQDNGLTAYKVSKDTGISQSTLSDWKTGRAMPKADKLLVLAHYFNVPIEFFLTNKEDV